MTSLRQKRADLVLSVACPTCLAQIDQECIGIQWDESMHLAKRFHLSRKRLVRADNMPSTSEMAANYLFQNKCTLTEAALEFGITRQAIHSWVSGHMPDALLPSQQRSIETRDAVRTLADQGATASEVAAAMGRHNSNVRTLARELGVQFRDGSGGIARQHPDLLERALDALREGATVSEAANLCGLSSGHLGVLMRRAGVTSTAWGGAAHWGISEKAQEIYERGGVSRSKAARLAGMAATAFIAWRKRRGYDK